MPWWNASSVTVANGSVNVTINAGDSIDNLPAASGLQIDTFAPVEVLRAYFNGTNNIIELRTAWPYATQTAKKAMAFITDADLTSISKSLSTYLSTFQIASQVEAEGLADNTKSMTALRVGQAINKVRPLMSNTMDFSTANAVLRRGDLGLGRHLDLRTSTTNYYGTHLDTPSKLFGKGFISGFMDGGTLGIAGLTTSSYGILKSYGHWDDYTGYVGSAYQQFLFFDGTWFRYATSASTWSSWKRQLNNGDLGLGTQIVGIKEIYDNLTPAQIAANIGDGVHYMGNILNHSSNAPEPWGIIEGYVTSGNAYSYSYQEFTGIQGARYRRTANTGTGWTSWKKVLVEGDYGIGGFNLAPSIPDANVLNRNGSYMVAASWVGSPYGGTDGKNQGYLTHLNWGDNTYCIQTFYNVNGSFFGKFRRKDNNTWSAWKDINELDLNYGITRAVPKFDYATNVDMNSLTEAGWYKLLANPTNSQNFPVQPTESTGWWYVQTLEYNEGAALQQYAYAYGGAGQANYIFTRSHYAGTWYRWQKIAGPDVGYVYYDNNVIGGSVGSVIERGANSNGEYTKFADGTIFAWGRKIENGLSINPATGYNANTGYLCDPIMPAPILDKVLCLGQHALYDSSDRLIYSMEAASSAGLPMILNLGTRPDATWPKIDNLGSSIATKVDYYWTATGRWR